MSERYYRVVIASTEGGLHVAAPLSDGWTILKSTIREFTELDSNDDQSLGDIGSIIVKHRGWIALAYIEVDSPA
jgi:hypothetical protein